MNTKLEIVLSSLDLCMRQHERYVILYMYIYLCNYVLMFQWSYDKITQLVKEISFLWAAKEEG